MPPRRSSRLQKQPAGLHREDTPYAYDAVKKSTRSEKEYEKKHASRASRAGRGMKRANTVFEYEGHPETRETADNPFGKIVGREIEIYFRKQKKWVAGKVLEHDAWNNLHIVEYKHNGEKHWFNLDKTKYRFAGDEESALPPTKKSRPNEDGDEEEDDDDAASGSEDDVHGPSLGAVTALHVPAPAASGFIASSEGRKAEVDPESGLVGKGAVFKDGSTVYEAHLAFVDRAINSDKYYILQVVEATDKATYWTVEHWGRTGTKGQNKVLEFDNKDDAIAEFSDKFTEKTGLHFDNRESDPVAGKYRFVKKVYSDGDDAKVMWQYYVNDFVDGKATGWYNYTDSAAAIVEGVHSEWRNNEWLDVRSVQSGYFEYRVDFNAMEQENLRTHKIRQIRRVLM
eukprot:m.286864 g.286864  ORF g.286864 m.286864 type:complete len:398 (+) comp11659_c0_seq1:228-1421(+)